MRLPVTIRSRTETVPTDALIDSGAEGIFINSQVAEEQNLQQHRIFDPIKIRNVDGTLNKDKEIN